MFSIYYNSKLSHIEVKIIQKPTEWEAKDSQVQTYFINFLQAILQQKYWSLLPLNLEKILEDWLG